MRILVRSSTCGAPTGSHESEGVGMDTDGRNQASATLVSRSDTTGDEDNRGRSRVCDKCDVNQMGCELLKCKDATVIMAM